MPIPLIQSALLYDSTHAQTVRPQSTITKIATPHIKTQTNSPKHVERAIKQVNDSFSKYGQNLYAAMEQDKKSGVDVVKVFDKTSNEVISQFPVKEIVAMAQAMSQSQKKGQMLHVRA
ncbi:MAG: flagellar protein FlaG [Gallionella sp.]